MSKQDKRNVLSAGVQKEISVRVQKETGLKGVFSEDFGPVVERRRWGLGDCPELSERVMDERDGGSFGWGDVPTAAEKVALVISVDASFQMEGQMQVQQGCRRTGSRGRALFLQGLLPSRVGAQAGGAADGGVLPFNLPVEHDLGSGVAADFFVGQEGHQPLLQGTKAAFDLAFGLRAGSDQMVHAQGGEGALELGARIAVIGHRIMAEEAQTVGIDGQREMVPEKEAAKVFEVIPRGVGGDEDGAQQLARMVIHGEQQGLLFLGRPPLVNGGIMLPEFAEARAFPSASGFGVGFRLADQGGKVGAGKGGDRLSVALETQAGGQFIGHELEVRRPLEGEELLEELDGFGRPVRPVVAAREPGGEVGTFLEEARAEPVKVGAADLEVVGGVHDVNNPFIELVEDVLKKRVGQAFCELLF